MMPNKSHERHLKYRFFRGLKLTIMMIICVVQMFPLYYLFTYSLKSNEEIFLTNPIGLPTNWIWENYSVALSNGKVGLYLINSVIVTGASILLVLASGVTASYALTRLHWRRRTLANNILMLGLTIPVHASVLPVFLILKNLGILNSHLSLILPYVAFNTPMAIMMMSGFMMTIPLEMEESAFIDGYSVWKTFMSIIIPLMSPGLSTAAIFTFIKVWNELLFAQVFISSNSLKTLPVGLKTLVSDFGTQWGQVGAGMMVATLPTMIIYLFLNKKVQESLIAGSVKG